MLVSIATLTALFLAEALSRVIPIPPEPPIKIFDDKIGFRLRPGMSGTWTVENPGSFTFNSFGFRDVEWTKRKKRRYRIAVLGDSFVEGLQVDLHQTFPKLLEKLVPNAEFMNFGISGQGQVEQLLTYRTYVRPFRPDLVILAFFPGNDCIDNWRRSQPSLKFPVYVMPTDNGVTVLPVEGFKRTTWFRIFVDSIMYHSSLLQRIHDARKAIIHRNMDNFGEAGLWEGVFGNPAGAVRNFDEMWSLTEKLVLQLYHEVISDTGRSDGLLMVCLTESVQVHRVHRNQFLANYPHLDPDYAEKRIRAFCITNGIPFFALSPDFLNFNDKTGKPLHGFHGIDNGHFNWDGHRMAAEAIAVQINILLQNK